MNPPQNTGDREEKALQALITAALHATGDEVSAEEIEKYLGADIKLTDEETAALGRRDSNPLVSSKAEPTSSSALQVVAEEFAALHRKKPKEGFSAETEDAIKKKREQLLAQLREKKKSG